MFVNLNIDEYIDQIKQESIKEKNKLINKYLKIKNEILHYCSNHNIIISDPNLLTDVNHIHNMLGFNLYSPNPFKHANNLSNELVKYTKNVEMQTKISHQDFIIKIDSQIKPMVNFYKFPKINVLDIIFICCIKRSIDSNDLLLMPPNVELMNIYRRLYLPSCAFEWKILLELEDKTFKCFDVLTPRDESYSIVNKSDSGSSRKSMQLDIKQTTFDRWCKKDGIVVIGYWIAGVLLDKKLQGERLQVISANHIQNDILSLEIFIEKEFSCKLTYSTCDVNIPQDFRLKKHTVIVNSSYGKICIMEIFNSASFELIPYITRPSIPDIKIGNPFVLLRFLFIDYWIIEFIMAIDKLPKKIGMIKLNFIMDLIKDLRQDKFIKLGFGKDFIGSYIDEQIADKIRRTESPLHLPYLPYMKKRII